jgi:hypothetical protein
VLHCHAERLYNKSQLLLAATAWRWRRREGEETTSACAGSSWGGFSPCLAAWDLDAKSLALFERVVLWRSRRLCRLVIAWCVVCAFDDRLQRDLLSLDSLTIMCAHLEVK